MPGFSDYFNRASEQRDRLIDIEAQRVAGGMPAAGGTSPGQGPATTPQTEEDRAKAFGVSTVTPKPAYGSYTGPPSAPSRTPFSLVAVDGVPTSALDNQGIAKAASGATLNSNLGLPASGSSGKDVGDFKLFKRGIARVPGKGDGTKDTVKAKLAPGEAVLNKAAADKMGRGLIGALNKMGAKKMGLV